MKTRLSNFFSLFLIISLMFGGYGQAQAQVKTQKADNGAQAMAMPGNTPHYFGPYPNYANSPLRLPDALVTITSALGLPVSIGNPRSARAYATDAAAQVFVVNTHTPLVAGDLTAFETWAQAGSGPHTFNAYVLRPTQGVADGYTVVFDSGPLNVPDMATGLQTFNLPTPFAVQAGDLIAHYGQGISLDIGGGADTTLYPAGPAPVLDQAFIFGVDYPVFSTDRTYSIAAVVAPPGSGATAAAVVDPATGTITNIAVTNGGSGYTAAPTVDISSAVATGAGASATATISGLVTNLALTNGGSGYTDPVSVVFSGGGGTGAAGTATVAPLGFVESATVINGGSNYTTATVDVTGDGTGATATAAIAPIGFVNGISLTSGGSGYTFATVDITGDGTGAAATATITPIGFVNGITLTNSGSGYTSATVTIEGGGGTGATADAVVELDGTISAITITGGGSGYTTAPIITINGDGTGAAADATVDTTSGAITEVVITDGGLGYTTAPTIAINGDGTGATADATVDVATGSVASITITNGGSNYTFADLTVAGDGSGATASATVNITAGSITSVTLTDGGSGYSSAPDVSFSDGSGGTGALAAATISGSISAITVVNGGTGYVTPGIRKFVDTLPGLGSNSANNLGQFIPVATPDTTSYPGTDYYEIELVQYTEKMHSDLPPTTLRGYRQANMGGTQPHYLGPLISATKDRPVRILFRNLLPTGTDGNLFLPVDTTVMGAGMGPNMDGMAEPDPQNPMCGMIPKPYDCYTENRATLHLHGGITPWISDGTPHQWITPANENTPYPEGVSVKNVPDMDVCGAPDDGCQTFYYTNQQSARLMFYHDHAWGITRLNVYAGEAAGYLITDPTEQALISQGIIPADQIPLIIQDKTFVPSMEQLATQDPTWDTARWGGEGNLWVPHVYMPAQNPGDASGVNQFGRWAYGPWFWPPTTNIAYPPVDNPYYDPMCDPDVQWCEPPLIPGVPNVSMGMEAFNDTPLVNGTVYPTITLDPKSYRLRILNAANDRFWNLQLYKAVDANGVVCNDALNPNPAPEATGVACTEVALNPLEVAAALDDPTVFPTPIKSNSGPNWIQIGTEGGFLPAPVVIPNQPITWVTDPTVFNAGNVDKHSLLLGPAERADVIVDLSQFAGQTLILYNDAPAAFPARDARYDYYTGNADLTATGGAPSTPAGYGPNTRTIMQIKVNGGQGQGFQLAPLQNAFRHQLDGSGVFESSQNPIIVGQSAYNSAYGTAFALNGANAGLVQIFNTTFSFKTLLGGAAGPSMTFSLKPKQIQDEMGEAFEKEYGRMSGYLGVEAPNANAGVQNMILYPYVNPASELLDGIVLPPGVEITPISAANDGTQIWKITHNGVDTHPIHFHLFDVQLINRVGWDGIIRRPDANELGWKDTVRISPLEDTIVAFRPILPKMPFGVPDSERLLNPMMPEGSQVGFNPTDTNGNPIPGGITNVLTNFGWEYVWHCHILSHEEMDMMRPLSVNAGNELPVVPTLTAAGVPTPGVPIVLSWTDGTPIDMQSIATWGDPRNEVGFRVERALGAGAFVNIGSIFPNVTTFTDTGTAPGFTYSYRIVAFNAAGVSESNIVVVTPPPPSAPIDLTATAISASQVNLTWTDTAATESGFRIERALVTNGTPGLFTGIDGVGENITSYSDTTVAPNTTYAYQVYAFNGSGNSLPSNIATVTTPDVPPAAPSGLTGVLQNGPQIGLAWTDNANNETSFVVERAVNGGAFAVLATLPADTVNYVDAAVMAGNTYTYQVMAANAGGSSAYSNSVSVTLLAPPAAPTNLVATLLANPTRIRLTWLDNATTETGFVVERSVNGGPFAMLTTVPARNGTGSVTYTTNTVTSGNIYSYRVVAINGAGSSAPSNVVNVTVGSIPAAPTNLVGTMLSNPLRIRLTFRDNATNETGLVLERSANGGPFTLLATLPPRNNTGNVTYNDTTVLAGNSYSYRVMAVNGVGPSAYSNTFTIGVMAPAAPSNFTGTAVVSGNNAIITLTWTDNSDNETRFEIQRATDAAFTTGLNTNTVAANTTTRVETRNRNRTYYYRIRAINAAGVSAWVNVVPFPIVTP